MEPDEAQTATKLETNKAEAQATVKTELPAVRAVETVPWQDDALQKSRLKLPSPLLFEKLEAIIEPPQEVKAEQGRSSQPHSLSFPSQSTMTLLKGEALSKC